MNGWLLFRPLIAYVLAYPTFVIAALLLLRDRQPRDGKDEIEPAENRFVHTINCVRGRDDGNG